MDLDNFFLHLCKWAISWILVFFEIYDKVQLLTILESDDSMFSLDNLFFEKTDEAEK